MILRDLVERFLPNAGRALAALSRFVEFLPRASEQQALLQSLCDALYAVGYRRALVGARSADDSLRVRPLVDSDPGDKSQEVDVSWGEVSRVQQTEGGLFGAVTPLLARNMLLDPRYADWKAEAVAGGYASAIVFPVVASEIPRLDLILYAAEPNTFDEGERELLEMLVGHLVLSLEALHRRIALERSESRYRHLVESMEDIVFTLDQRGCLTYVSPAVERLTGFAPSAYVGRNLARLGDSNMTALAQALMCDMDAGRKHVEKWPVTTRSGEAHVLRVSSIPSCSDPHESVGIARDITQQLQAERELRIAFEGTMGALGAVTVARDPYTARHQKRVARLASAIAKQMGLASERVRAVRYAGLVHDIGKMSIPSEILTKPSRLTEAERGLVRGHPEAAFEILKRIRSPWPLADIALQHHERMDGSGYPRGLVGDEILLESRILAVADVTEAMGSYRPYRPSLGLRRALQELVDHRGTLYDERAVDACLHLFRSTPLGIERDT